MKMRSMQSLKFVTGLAASAILFAGCGSNTPQQTAQTAAANAVTPTTNTDIKVATAPDAKPKDSSGWQTFTSKNGGYTVSMPGKAEVKSTPVETELGNINAQIASVAADDNAYLVIFADYPEAVQKADPQKILDGARSGAVKRLNGKLQNEKKITINGFPGREFSATTTMGDRKAFLKARIYLVNRRLYQQIAVTPAAPKPVEKINKFLDSFKIQAKKG